MSDVTAPPFKAAEDRYLYQLPTRASGRDVLSAITCPVLYAVKVPGDRIKIGHTTHIRNRFQSLGVGMRAMLAMLLNGTLEEEQAIHARLRGHAVEGREWYSATDPDVIAVVNEMRATMGLGSSPLTAA